MVICTLKFVMSTMFWFTVSVIVAATTLPGFSLVPSLFHVTVIGPLAFDGFQFWVVMFRASEVPCPVFFM